ncbi:hypothetical protein [Arcobacter arenosus]|uniref:Uncharacterized protein n=1 Tax=Arcobacter arenosus TaxID=2576037 RepID=A0A5R8XZD8_9BACT|nr:hypothetical protein [Arcobacter arenosus]TLP36819.1 hypothetical protein FDK22_11250 [Arcobacter arenosus]
MIITLFIFLSLLSQDNNDNGDLVKYLAIISSISVYLTFLFTPLSYEYWLYNGGRLYIGDTENPNLVASLTSINIISTVFYLFTKDSNKKIILIITPSIFASIYLYLLSQGKSTSIGLFLILLFLIFKNFKYLLIKFKYYIKAFSFVFFLLVGLLFYYKDKFQNYINILFSSFETLFGDKSNALAKSADIRKENFSEAFNYISSDNIFGHGINTFRMDSPILQANIDLGNIYTVFLIYIFLIVPLIIIATKKFIRLNDNSKMVFLLYLFYFPNLFFHGTPYEYSIWLPVLLMLKFNTYTKEKNENYTHH